MPGSARLPAVAASGAGESPGSPISDKSIAVLPFVNLSGDNKDSYLGDGISGEILSALSKLAGLKVIGRASSCNSKPLRRNAMLIT